MKTPIRQSGATLLVTLIMLVVLTLFAITAINVSNVSLRVVGNMQAQEEARLAAQQAIEQIISSGTSFGSTGNTSVNVDINNGGANEYTVTVFAPVCMRATAAPGYSAQFIASAPKDTAWDVTAEVTSTVTGAKATVHQGIAMRMPVTGSCP